MVFRKENKGDSFQRQMSALRQQIGSGNPAEEPEEQPRYPQDRAANAPYAPPSAEEAGGAYGLGEFTATGADQGQNDPSVPTAPTLPDMPIVDAHTTVVAQDATWKGEIQSEGTVHVHGRYEGSITAKSDIFVAEPANVDATLTATNVIVAGVIKGTVRCDARFEVLPSGRVSGDVQAPTLVVHEGAVVAGQLRMGAADVPETTPTPVVQRRATRGLA